MKERPTSSFELFVMSLGGALLGMLLTLLVLAVINNGTLDFATLGTKVYPGWISINGEFMSPTYNDSSIVARIDELEKEVADLKGHGNE
jgi:hypothetical protein